MMKKFSIVVLATACLASPAMALEHEVVIEHATGTIAADYVGTVTVETRQVGSPGPGGRPTTLRCVWTASLSVDRTAKVGESLRSSRSMVRDNVVSGSKPGWCETQAKAIDRLVDSRRETFHAAMLALAEQDRSAILAEADGVRSFNRQG